MATPRMDKSLGPSGTAPGGYYGSRVPHFPEPSDHAARDDWNPFDNRAFGGYYGEYDGRRYSFHPADERETGPWPRDDHLGYGPIPGIGRGIHRGGGVQNWDLGKEKHFKGIGPEGYIRPDERIAEEVHDLMTGHPDLDASGIHLRVHDGIVELRGDVADREQKWLAEDLADEVMGVQDVDNQLKVGRPARR